MKRLIIINLLVIACSFLLQLNPTQAQALPQVVISSVEEVKPFPVPHLGEIRDRNITFKLLNNTEREIIVYGDHEKSGFLNPVRYRLYFNKKTNKWTYPNPENKPLPWKKEHPRYKVEKTLKPGEFLLFSSSFSSESDCGRSYKITVQVKLKKSRKAQEIRSEAIVMEPCK